MNPSFFINKGISLSKILKRINKTLNVAQEIIPIYTKSKPMIENSKKIFNTLKSINIKSDNNKSNNEKLITNKKTDNYNNLPVFFS